MASPDAIVDRLDPGEHNPHAVGLKRDALSFTEALAQSIANIAPTAMPAVTLQLVFASSGNGTWFTYLLATLGLLLLGVCINQSARENPTPGSLYSYVAKGRGPATGFITGWGLILGYLATGVAVVAGCATYAAALFNEIGLHAGLYTLYAIIAGLVWAIAYRDVSLSAKMMLLLEMTSLALILTLGVIVVARKGFFLDAQQLLLRDMDLKGLRAGMVLAIFCFVGFESATALGAETREPRKSIPLAVLYSTAIAGAFFVIMSFIMVSAFRDNLTPLDKTPAPLNALAAMARLPALGILVSVGAMISFFACALACVTAVSRVLMSMARDGVIHASIGRTHDINATPHVAATLAAAVMFLVPAAMSLDGIGMLDIYALNGTIATYGFLVAYVLIAEGALTAAVRRRWAGIAVAGAAIATIVLLLVAVAGSVYPWPDAPFSALPPIFAAYMAGGAAWMLYDSRRARAGGDRISGA